jgi:hypothetical protein
LALIALPISSSLAGGPSFANLATDIGIIRDYLEVNIILTRLSCAGICGVRQGEKDIVRSRARKLSTVFNDGPLVGRVIEESHRCCVYIIKYDVGHVVHRNLIRGEFVSCKDTLPALASCLSATVKVLEGYVVELRDTSKSTIRFNLVDGARRSIRNVESLCHDIVTKKH